MKWKMSFIILLLFFITGCTTSESDDPEIIIYGEVVETFPYEQEAITIEGDFENTHIDGSLLFVGVSDAEIINKDGEIIELEDLHVGYQVEVLLPNTDLNDSDPQSTRGDRVRIID
ncbi:hypothetical protein QA612_07945 [Evansella sp. AB-P1]|uniref:hypothetical protein n=1 Tax=Evansella sp. AB-P1 TaxID=3037653 RepID=UPI00241F0243|nr:hypothetical protein [Evansella sp. AB-P1]MDG5787424.1 hypothetical protein [Evansella sp. AB-P1]